MIIAIDARPLVTRQIGGAEQRARNIIASWAAALTTHEFQLLYSPPEDATLFDDTFISKLPHNFIPVEISSLHMPSPYPMATRLFNPLARTLAKMQPDVYHAFTPLVPKTIVCPVVPTVHDLSFELDPVVRRTPAGRDLRRVTLTSIKYAGRIIAISSQTKNDIASIYHVEPERIDVVFNGIDPIFTPAANLTALASVHTNNDISGSYIFSVGADIPRRNYHRMLTALRQVWAAGNKSKWVLAGRQNWKESPIYTEAQKTGVLEKMRFVDAPTNQELADLYRHATITCCGSSFEGFGLSVLESMACGTPVTCSDMRSLREVAEDAALYFAHDDASAMAEAIAGLLEDAEYRRQLKYRGLRRAQLFTWATAATLTLDTLAAVTAPR